MYTNRFKSKLTKFVVMLLALSMLLTIITPVNVTAQQDDKKKKEEEQKKKEEEQKKKKAEDKAAQKQAKEEKQYQEIKKFSLDLYQKDPEFKEDVDAQFSDIKRMHSRQAYLINTRGSNEKLVTRENDKLNFEDTLYDNPMAQDYVNRVGQSLVPKTSQNLYAFRIVQNPVPESRALSTGTVYISTGYLSVVDNEAQLAYILGHEISHVEKNHWFEDVLVALGTGKYNEARQKKAKRWALIGTIAAATVGGLAGGADGLNAGLGAALLAAPMIIKIVKPDVVVEWDKVQEDEADLDSLKYMFDRNYDVREIPKFYDRMARVTSDSRSQTGFISDSERIKERLVTYNAASQQYLSAGKTGMIYGAMNFADARISQNQPPKPNLPSADKGKNLALTGSRGIARMLNETLAPDIQKKLEAGELLASSEEFQTIMALLKRDNGIKAYYFDMFRMSRENLEDSIRIRNNDPFAFFYYGKVMKQTARTPTDVSKALETLANAIDLDKRQTIAEPYFYRAMIRLAERNPSEAQSIISDLKTYVDIYQRENSGALPPNIEVIYDFMQDFGEYDYRATPAINVATKNIAPIQITESNRTNNTMTPTTTTSTPTTTTTQQKQTKGKP